MKKVLMKVGNVILGILGFLLMVMPLVAAFQREASFPFIFLAFLVCPLWYWYLRKRKLKNRDVFAWVLRGVCLAAGFVLMIFFSRVYPFYRAWDFVTKDRAEDYFLSQILTEDMEYENVGEIGKADNNDYCTLAVQVLYRAKETGEHRSRKVTLYFDKYTAWYYTDFEAMKKDRKERMAKGGREYQLFDGEQVYARLDEITDAFVGNQYEAELSMMCPDLREKVTRDVWDGWQSFNQGMGEYEKVKGPIGMKFATVEEGSESQLLQAVETLIYADGQLKLSVTLYDDLSIKEMDVKVDEPEPTDKRRR